MYIMCSFVDILPDDYGYRGLAGFYGRFSDVPMSKCAVDKTHIELLLMFSMFLYYVFQSHDLATSTFLCSKSQSSSSQTFLLQMSI